MTDPIDELAHSADPEALAKLLAIPPGGTGGAASPAAGSPNAPEATAVVQAAPERGDPLPATTPGALASPASAAEPANATGTVIGRYKLLQPIGEGGFGSVYMAEQEQPVRRRVALKVIKPGMDSKQVVARFEAERQALAMMDHPNIAKVLDGGTTDSGRPYFVMELVKGVPITTYCDENRLNTEERLELFAQVCHAVQHAHQKGIIHRDLKPSNVLVTLLDGRPVPKVIDFGIAKALNQRLTDRTLFTEFRQLIGTPEYMSPEQAGLSALDVDTRSDVYSLGVLLYELLTGTTPFDRKQLQQAAYAEIERIIREVEPPKPSTKLSTMAEAALATVAAHRKSEPRKLGRTVRGELDWMVMKCLEKDRARRYETANALAMDIHEYLAGEAVSAGPPSAAYRARKFVRRHRLGLSAAAAVVSVLMLLSGVITYAAVRDARLQARHVAQLKIEQEKTLREKEAAVRARAKAVATSNFLVYMFHGDLFHRSLGRASLTLREMLDEGARQLDRGGLGSLRGQPEAEAAVRTSLGTTYRQLRLIPEAETQLRRALELRRRHQPGSLELAESLDELAASMGAFKHDVASAEPLHVEALELRIALLGPEHPDVARSLVRVAQMQRQKGNVSEAERLYRQALSIVDKAPAATPEQRVSVRESFVSFLELKPQTPDVAEAEALLNEALAIERGRLGGRHAGVVAMLNRLGGFLSYKDRNLPQAETLHKAAVEMADSVADDDYPRENLLGFRHNLAQVLRKRGNVKEAEQVEREMEALRIAENERNIRARPNDPTPICARGRQLARQGQFQDALKDVEHGFRLKFKPPEEPGADQLSKNAGDYRDWRLSACLKLFLGDKQGYRRDCLEMYWRYGDTTDRTISDYVVRVCMLLPDALPPEYQKRLTELADQIVAPGVPAVSWWQIDKGIAEYRAGHFKDAVDWLAKGRGGLNVKMEQERDGAVEADLFLAMAYHQLGNAAKAAEKFALATEVMGSDNFSRERPADDRLMCLILHKEAEPLFRPAAPAATRPSSNPAVR